MKTWFIIQTIVDIVLFFLVFLYLFNIKKKIPTYKNSPQDVEKLTNILESLNIIVEESEKASEKLITTVEKKEAEIKDLLKKLVTEKEWLINHPQKNHSENAPLSPSSPISSIPHNKYDHASLLLKNGLSIDDIAKKTALSKGEVELIKNIKQ